MNSTELLLKKYPNVKVVEVSQELDQDTFNAQKIKHEQRQAEGGAIGTVWLEDGTIVLTKRSGLHAGWALIGGTVENGEAFDDAFLREVKEEIGIKATIGRIVMLERKIFTSPNAEQLPMNVAVIEAHAEKGEQITKTKDAEIEGLEAKAFAINSLPSEMILNDLNKLELVVAARRV
ncbi:MAG: NUDIX hydrolase [Candidatus Saccharimonadales bacterium]